MRKVQLPNNLKKKYYGLSPQIVTQILYKPVFNYDNVHFLIMKISKDTKIFSKFFNHFLIMKISKDTKFFNQYLVLHRCLN